RASRHRYPTPHLRDAVLPPGFVALRNWATGHIASSVCPVPCLPPLPTVEPLALPHLSVLCSALWVNPPATASAEGRQLNGAPSSPYHTSSTFLWRLPI